MSMTESGYLIHLALKLLKCTQKSLAEKLDVSATQITKWKSGEYMSIDMREKMEEMLDLKGISPNVVLMSGSVENATEWLSLIYYLANLASEHSETGYVTTPLEGEDELESLGWSTFITLEDMGVTLPDSFPSELRIINNASDDDNSELVYFTVMDNPYASLIYNIYLKLNDVYGFYAAYLYKVMINEELDLFDTEACNIESGLMDLAASKLDDEEAYLANNFQNFRFKTNKDFEEWLNVVKVTAIQHNVPLGAELLDLVHQSPGALGHHAEREALGFNNDRIHPDIYMNELLVGMRVLHRILPVMAEKLGIQDYYKPDE